MGIFRWFRHLGDKAETPPDIDERLRALERDSKQLRLEWDDTYESISRLVRKLSKREQRALQEEEAPTQPDIAPPADTREALRAVARARGLMR